MGTGFVVGSGDLVVSGEIIREPRAASRSRSGFVGVGRRDLSPAAGY